jgi:hypothetical protein
MRLPRASRIAAAGIFFAVLALVSSSLAGAEDKPAAPCTTTEAEAKQSAHEYVDLLLTGDNNFVLVFHQDWGPNGTMRCATEPFLKEFVAYETSRVGRSDLILGVTPGPPTIGFYSSEYKDSNGERQGFKLNLIQILVVDALGSLKAGATPETVNVFLAGRLDPGSTALFVDLFNKGLADLAYHGNKLHVTASVFGKTHVNVKRSDD